MIPEHKYSLPRGFRLRQYEIVRLLGYGGFGMTYLADDANLHRKVAIKELLPMDFAIRETDGAAVVARTQKDATNLEWARQRFVEEGRTLAALQHPSILPVYDIFELHGTAYLVTGFIEGCNFEDWLRDGRAVRQEVLLPMAVSLLDALRLVHEQGFLHRDIKPENILVDRSTSRPVLIDFGNARMATGEKTSNMTAVVTRGYAPLEQYQTKSRQGPSTDIYALGAVLYRAIKGAPPDDALDRLDDDKVRALSGQRIPGYAQEFLATIDKALKMRPEDRWQNCEEWKVAIRGGGQTSVQPPLVHLPRPRSRFKTGWVIAGIALLALCGAGIGFLKWSSGGQNTTAGNDSSGRPAAAPDDSSTPNKNTPGSGLSGFPAPNIVQPSPLQRPNATPSPAASPGERPHPDSPGLQHPYATPAPAASLRGVTPELATVDHPFVNSLGMKFAPVAGVKALFSVWDTRVQDYAEYAREKGITPTMPDFEQGPTHPVVNVVWEDAQAFCEWLSAKEGRAYRLPMDAEWSTAVGLGKEQGSTPEKKRNLGPEDIYPWGRAWPPPQGAGNYGNIDGYHDGYANTSPVGSFPANQSGLYDMGGNVWQWCEDWYDAVQKYRVLRGGSWGNVDPLALRSTYRYYDLPRHRNDYNGFRCVLVVSGG
jgi:serine/threonine protein kinase